MRKSFVSLFNFLVRYLAKAPDLTKVPEIRLTDLLMAETDIPSYSFVILAKTSSSASSLFCDFIVDSFSSFAFACLCRFIMYSIPSRSMPATPPSFCLLASGFCTVPRTRLCIPVLSSGSSLVVIPAGLSVLPRCSLSSFLLPPSMPLALIPFSSSLRLSSSHSLSYICLSIQ